MDINSEFSCNGKVDGQAARWLQLGSLNRAHHFGLKRAATFGEQLILQDSVTQSISSPVLSFASGGGAAAAAAGDKLPLFGVPCGAACCGASWGAAWLVGGSGRGSS